MRVFINGFEIEGTPEEIRALVTKETKKEANKEREVVKPALLLPNDYAYIPADKPIIRRRKGYKRLKSDAKKELLTKAVRYSMENHTSLSASLKAVLKAERPERTACAGAEIKKMRKIAHKLGYDYKVVREKKRRGNNRGDRKGDITDARVVRMRFINGRVKQLTRENAMSYERALETACDDWRAKTKNKGGFIERKVSFPSLKSVKPELNTILKDISERVINNKGSITFIGDAYAIGIDNVKEWLVFLADFIRHSDEITMSFGVPNLFKINNGISITYGA